MYTIRTYCTYLPSSIQYTYTAVTSTVAINHGNPYLQHSMYIRA